MSTIRNTIHESLSAAGLTSYERQAEPVIAALEEREEQVVASLREQAESFGLGTEETEQVLVTAGLIEPTPEPEVMDPENQGDLATVLAAIESLRQDISQIKAAAARHGVRV